MNTEEMIEVMQAFARGDACQGRIRKSGGDWGALTDPCWNWEAFEFRIKPREPTIIHLDESVLPPGTQYEVRIVPKPETREPREWLLHFNHERDHQPTSHTKEGIERIRIIGGFTVRVREVL